MKKKGKGDYQPIIDVFCQNIAIFLFLYYISVYTKNKTYYSCQKRLYVDKRIRKINNLSFQ